MPNLLRFNPEPFEDPTAPAGEYDHAGACTGDALEDERGGRRPRVRPAPRGGRRPSGRRKPPVQVPRFPRRPTTRLPFVPFLPPAWPIFPTPEPPQDGLPGRDAGRAEPPRGAPAGTQPSQPEPAEAPSEFVRWVQSCLNQVMGLRLPSDGIMDPATRSAIRGFQERHGLRIDGLVGPETERALVDACAPAYPSTANAGPTGPLPAADTQPGELPWLPEAEWASSPDSRRPRTPSAGAAPRLLQQTSTPPGTTLYVRIDLGIADTFGITAAPVTGIFLPEGYVPGATVDVLLYLHGHKSAKLRRQTIEQYWNSQRFPYSAFREGVNASQRNVILVAPSLGSRSEAGRLLRPGGLDAYLEQVLAALHAYGPHRHRGTTPDLGNLILVCHSGAGWPMRQLAGGRERALARVRECWGFDCTYNRGDDAFWAGWARTRSHATVYIYYVVASPTARLAASLRNMRVPNAIVQPSRDGRHNYVPIAHWVERLQGASFLTVRPGGTVQPAPMPPAPGSDRGTARHLKR